MDNNQNKAKTSQFVDEELTQRFLKYLKTKNLKLTSQRKIILEEFLCQGEHVSAEELYLFLRSKHPSIGQATVFRTLRLIAGAGIAQEVRTDDRILRYEPQVEGEHHDHMRCLSCGKTIEFQDDDLEALQLKIAAKYSFILTSHRMDLFGLCSSCQKA